MRPHGKGQRPKSLSFALGNIEGLFFNQSVSFCTDGNILNFTTNILFNVFNIFACVLRKLRI